MLTVDKTALTQDETPDGQALEHRGAPAARGYLGEVQFGRSRLLAGAGAGLLTLATKMWFADVASANHGVPNGCFGYHWCPMCSGTSCVSGCCGARTCCCPPAGVANQCWESCAYEGATLYRIKCCDWDECGAGGCICRGFLGPC